MAMVMPKRGRSDCEGYEGGLVGQTGIKGGLDWKTRRKKKRQTAASTIQRRGGRERRRAGGVGRRGRGEGKRKTVVGARSLSGRGTVFNRHSPKRGALTKST